VQVPRRISPDVGMNPDRSCLSQSRMALPAVGRSTRSCREHVRNYPANVMALLPQHYQIVKQAVMV